MSATVRRSSRQWLTDQFTRSLMLRIATGLKVEAIKPAMQLTSGAITTKQLAEADHPFARRNRSASGRLRRGSTREIREARRAVGRFPKLPINRQTGALQRAIRIQSRQAGEGVWRLYIDVNHPHAAVLSPQGTRHMIPRGFVEELQRRMTSQQMLSRLRGIIRRTRLK
jgi:hypothetical protein